MLPNFLQNYELTKLGIEDATIQSAMIILALGTLSLLLLRKQSTSFLNRDQTDQLRGASILLIMCGHLWTHACGVHPNPHPGGYGVTMFLLVSGFGLTASIYNKSFSSQRFIYRRLKRVMIPYWIMTAVWITADYFLLDRTYGIFDIVSTTAGINLNETVDHIDYSRWYITKIILWYIIFATVSRYLPQSRALLGLYGCAFVMIVLQLRGLFPLGDPLQILAFPTGALLAYNRNSFRDILSVHRRSIAYFFGIFIVACLTIMWITNSLPVKALKYGLKDGAMLAYCILLIIGISALGEKGYVSNFLRSWGTVSYGAFLIHGPLLIKYNPIMGWAWDISVFMSMAIFLTMIWLIARPFHMVLDQVWAWVDELENWRSKPIQTMAVTDAGVTSLVNRNHVDPV